MQIDPALLSKYNRPVPRYTSYPTVPFWKEIIPVAEWERKFAEAFTINNKKEGISLYIHLPFCEKMCTYCGCYKKITTNHSVENQYIEAVLQELDSYLGLIHEKPVIREIHLGGGTPTFFSPANLEWLLDGILSKTVLHPDYEFSIEGHPNNTSPEHLKILYKLGFRRISLGVQDNDPEVQRVINRIQPLENVQMVTETARQIGFTSVNYDLIYGLPLQNVERMQKTILQTIALRPDRIAFYSYAHVPWTSKSQRLFDEHDLPSVDEKMELYQLGKRLFMKNGYIDIGMDHFALPTDDLYKARQEGRLHRNFMGYTTQPTTVLLALGVSAISDIGNGFAQNTKSLHAYYADINDKKLPIRRGYFPTEEDIIFRQYIKDVSCKGVTEFNKNDLPLLKKYTFPELEKMAVDCLVEFDEAGLAVTKTGQHFIRNICRAFDLHLLRSVQKEAEPVFSKAI